MEDEQNAPTQRTDQPARPSEEHVQETHWEPPEPKPELIGIIDKGYEHPSKEWVDEGRRLSESDGRG